jgi:hypothetical protein
MTPSAGSELAFSKLESNSALDHHVSVAAVTVTGVTDASAVCRCLRAPEGALGADMGLPPGPCRAAGSVEVSPKWVRIREKVVKTPCRPVFGEMGLVGCPGRRGPGGGAGGGGENPHLIFTRINTRVKRSPRSNRAPGERSRSGAAGRRPASHGLSTCRLSHHCYLRNEIKHHFSRGLRRRFGLVRASVHTCPAAARPVSRVLLTYQR